jgi:hypothetical protein
MEVVGSLVTYSATHITRSVGGACGRWRPVQPWGAPGLASRQPRAGAGQSTRRGKRRRRPGLAMGQRHPDSRLGGDASWNRQSPQPRWQQQTPDRCLPPCLPAPGRLGNGAGQCASKGRCSVLVGAKVWRRRWRFDLVVVLAYDRCSIELGGSQAWSSSGEGGCPLEGSTRGWPLAAASRWPKPSMDGHASAPIAGDWADGGGERIREGADRVFSLGNRTATCRSNLIVANGRHTIMRFGGRAKQSNKKLDDYRVRNPFAFIIRYR